MTLVTGKTNTAVIRILGRWFGVSPRSAYRHRPVQKENTPGSITVTPLG